MIARTAHERQRGGVVHAVLFYRSEREYLDSVVSFITAGLGAAHAVLVALPRDTLSTLQAVLGPDAGRVSMLDMTEVGRNPGRILGVLGTFAEDHPCRPLRIVGEPIWPGRSETAYPACVQQEVLLNTAFGDRDDVTILCGYDAARLAPSVLADACATHPLIWRSETITRSADYAPEVMFEHGNEPLPSDPNAATYTVRERIELLHLRRFTSDYARRLDLPRRTSVDLQLISHELACNSLEHTTGACRMALWRHDQHVVCEVRDSGHLTDPVAGLLPPVHGQEHGRGLFLIHALADLVRTHTTPHGTTIHAYLDPSHQPDEAP